MQKRTGDFERNADQESVLQEVNHLLGKVEQEAFPADVVEPHLPIVFIVGAPRSGTTLMLQWLAASGRFAYPTNLLSRFYTAPYLGARIQQLLTDPRFDYRNELTVPDTGEFAWTSDSGKTRGMLQPHEFFYYWRRFFPVDQAQKLTEEQLAASDPRGFAAGWGLIQRVFDKPVAAKGILLQYDIPLLAEWLPQAVFVYTRREPFFNMQSLLHARERVFGTRDAWFSVQPPEYEWLRHEDPYTQVAGQVLYTNRAIEDSLGALPPARSIWVRYEEFCRDPASVWRQLGHPLMQMGFDLPGEYDGPSGFQVTNEIRCSGADEQRIRAAHEKLASSHRPVDETP